MYNIFCLLDGNPKFFYEIEQFCKIEIILVKLQSEGIWGCGLASERCDLSSVPLKEQSWVLRSDSKLYSNGKEQEQVAEIVEGDVIGITYDHVELQFYRNGTDAVFYRTYPLLYQKFENMVIFRSGNLYSRCSPGLSENYSFFYQEGRN